MQSPSILALALSSLSLAGCNTLTPAQIANLSCIEAQAGAGIAVAITSDANTGANATNAAARAQQTANILQKSASDACPLIINGAAAVSATVAGAGSTSK